MCDKKGKWIDDRMIIRCSECGAEYSDEILFMNRNCKCEGLNFCPNCGAKMDAKEDSACW